jgi:hypothetical protein
MSENVVVSKDVLQKALEALEAMKAEFRALDLPYGSKAYAAGNQAAHGLRAALAQQEPIAHTVTGKLGDICHFRSTSVRKGDKVYTAPHHPKAKEIYTCGWQDAVKTLFTLMHELQQDPVRVHPSYHWLLNYISQHVASPNYPEAIIQRHFERSPYGAKQEQKTA